MEFLGTGDCAPSPAAKGTRVAASTFRADGDKLGGCDAFFVTVAEGAVHIALGKAAGR
jgi:hypothetical protein